MSAERALPSRGDERDKRKAYNIAAADYDAMRYDAGEGRFFNELEIEILRDWLRPAAGVKLLELPAGTGRLAVPLAATGATVVGGISARTCCGLRSKRSNEMARSMHTSPRLTG